MTRVLVGTGDLRLASFVRRGLRDAGLTVDIAATSDDVLDLAANGEHAAIVLDTGSDAVGATPCEALRRDGVWTPVLILAPEGTDGARRQDDEAVADAVLTKPFSQADLVSRVRALVSGIAPEAPLAAGDLILDPAARGARRGLQSIDLSAKEFALLELLVRRAGSVVDRQQLLEHAWDYEFENRSNIVDVYVGYLREKIDRPFALHTIETVRGAGYRLRAG